MRARTKGGNRQGSAGRRGASPSKQGVTGRGTAGRRAAPVTFNRICFIINPNFR